MNVVIDCLEVHTHGHYIDSSDPRTWYTSSSLCVIFGFFHHGFMVFCTRSLLSLSEHIPKYLILFPGW